jgi:hypothetical protein
MGLDLRRLVRQGWLEASVVFRPMLESSRLPPSVPRALHCSGVDGARVGSWGGCLGRYLLGGDVFLYSILICFWCILGGEVVDAREGSGLPWRPNLSEWCVL